jgi:hypothetical protein
VDITAYLYLISRDPDLGSKLIPSLVPSQLPRSLPQSTAPGPCGIILELALLVLVCKLVAAQWLCSIVLANRVKSWGGVNYTYRGHSSCLCRLSEPRKITALNRDLCVLSKLSAEGRSTNSSPRNLQAHRAVAGKAESGRRCQRFERLHKSLFLRATNKTTTVQRYLFRPRNLVPS